MRRVALIAATLLLSSACYHATIETGAVPTTTVIEKEWANSFIYGLVPPETISTAQQCRNGVARVETEQSFLNGLVAGLTFGIYTPMHIRVTCGTGRMSNVPVVKGTTDVAASLQKAVDLSIAMDSPVELELAH
jgi:hypothetical protein